MPVDENKLIQVLLEMGERLLVSGAEVNRVEDTLSRLGLAYGAAKMNVFVITSTIMITMEKQDGALLTHTRRVHLEGSTNFTALEQLNALSRSCCSAPIPLEEFEERLSLCPAKKSRWNLYLGGILGAGSFALFFGGSVLDGLAAALFAVIICLLQEKGAKLFYNNIMFNLACSFVIGLLICLTAKLLPCLQADKVMIGDIMLLIPGIAMTNAIRNMLMGDTMAGTMRLIESLLWAGALASGFMASIWMVGL
ncbi:MAG: threonine/serine exporter family protein [Eubacteriales bacterium]|nr:threonine/serine exporter family protein [Eubacteriales bacterium]